jgi:ATP adenylyltransferase
MGCSCVLSPTHLSLQVIQLAQFQIRFSPALANKPKSSKPKNSNEKPFDPFEAPPKGLLIASLPNYNLVLNKFPIIPDHFILATKSFKEQTGLLEEEDLGAVYVCLRAYKDNGKELYGFFNSGEFSGASQAHRHIQFLPVESMRIGMKEGDKWDVLVDTMTSEPGMFKFDLSYPSGYPSPTSQSLQALKC